MSITFCGKCGYNNPEECHFCVNCGADMFDSTGEPVPDRQPVERLSPYDPNRQYMQPVPPPYQQGPYGTPLPPVPVPVQPKKAEVLNYQPKGRKFAIALSITAMVLTIITLFGMPADFASFDNTVLRIGMQPGEEVILVLTFVTLAIAIAALLEPILCIVTGILIIVIASLLASGPVIDSFLAANLIVFILIAVDIMVLGIVSMIFMRKFVDNNVKDVDMFKSCYLTWVGIPRQ